MRRFWILTASGLYHLALVFWIGSLFFLSFIVAPTSFQQLTQPQAGSVISVIINKLNYLEYACFTVLLGSLVFFLLVSKARTNWLRLFLVLIMTGLTLYYGTILRPQMSILRKDMQNNQSTMSPTKDSSQQKFYKLHKRYEILVGANFILGLVLIFSSGLPLYKKE